MGGMNIVNNAFPPNIDEIDAVFGPRGGRKDVMYAWGRNIFNPDSVDIPPWIVAHEAVHGWRQLNPVFIAPNDPQAQRILTAPDEVKIGMWWSSYLRDKEFRAAEELVAHAAEYRYFHRAHPGDRRLRRLYLTAVAERLSGPLYGHLFRLEQAKQAIKKMAKESGQEGDDD